ncbi:MAG: type II secretion system F family protein [Acidobacteria bacterium]|jgi:tight adherence protein C|nr:type II secretion system F family protein [Acidobacteriota bacterium]
MISALFFILCFAAVAALLWSGFQLMQPVENPLDDRLDILMSVSRGTSSRQPKRQFGTGFWERFLYIINLVPGVDSVLEESEQLLRQAGVRKREAVAYYAMFNLIFLLILLLASWFVQPDDKPIFSRALGLAPAFLLGWLLPKQVLYRLMKRYRNKLQESLPDTVDLLGIVLGTGLALDQALTRVCEEMQFIYPELSGEFFTVVMQVKAGQDRSKAFKQLVQRTGIEDIKSLAAMIIQSERFGTSLSHALKVYADSLRSRRRLRGEAMVGKAGIKMVLATVVFILPVVFIITLVPAMLTMMNNLKGGIGASAGR